MGSCLNDLLDMAEDIASAEEGEWEEEEEEEEEEADDNLLDTEAEASEKTKPEASQQERLRQVSVQTFVDNYITSAAEKAKNKRAAELQEAEQAKQRRLFENEAAEKRRLSAMELECKRHCEALADAICTENRLSEEEEEEVECARLQQEEEQALIELEAEFQRTNAMRLRQEQEQAAVWYEADGPPEEILNLANSELVQEARSLAVSGYTPPTGVLVPPPLGHAGASSSSTSRVRTRQARGGGARAQWYTAMHKAEKQGWLASFLARNPPPPRSAQGAASSSG